MTRLAPGRQGRSRCPGLHCNRSCRCGPDFPIGGEPGVSPSIVRESLISRTMPTPRRYRPCPQHQQTLPRNDGYEPALRRIVRSVMNLFMPTCFKLSARLSSNLPRRCHSGKSHCVAISFTRSPILFPLLQFFGEMLDSVAPRASRQLLSTFGTDAA